MTQGTASDSVESQRAAVEASLRALTDRAESTPPTGGKAMLGLLLTVALLAVGWYSTFMEMWLRWFPGWDERWDDHNLSFTRRFTIGDSYYSHGPLVVLACLGAAWLIHKRVGLPVRRSLSATIVGGLLLAASLGLHLLSVYARVMFASGFAFVGVIGALVLLWGGWTLARAYWLPVVFIAFMVPLPIDLIAQLNFKLKFMAGGAAMWLTNNVFNIPAVMDGSYVYLPNGPDGSPRMLVVENVCSGLRSLISLIWFASMFAMICRARGGWRLFMLLLAVPIAIGCNIVRITTLNVGAHLWGTQVASEGAALHDWSGILVFVLALAVLFAVESLIVAAGRRLHRPWSDRRLLGFLDNVRGDGMSTIRTARPLVLLSLAGAAALAVMWSRVEVAPNRSDFAKSAVPMAVEVDGVTLNGTDFPLDTKTLTILETDDYLFRRFQASAGDRRDRIGFDLLIVFSKDNRKGTHPPDVCLEGAGAQIVSKAFHTIDVEGVGPIRMKGLVTQQHGTSDYHLFVYKCGESYTPNFFVQQATIFWNGMLQRNAAGALIRISLPIGTEEGARERAAAYAQAAARTVMPLIDRNLP